MTKNYMNDGNSESPLGDLGARVHVCNLTLNYKGFGCLQNRLLLENGEIKAVENILKAA